MSGERRFAFMLAFSEVYKHCVEAPRTYCGTTVACVTPFLLVLFFHLKIML